MVSKHAGAMLAIAVLTSGLVGAVGPQLGLQGSTAATTQPAAAGGPTGTIVIHGAATPGDDVSITARLFDEPLTDATVEINDRAVGETDANGTIRHVTVPDAGEFEVDVESAAVDLKLELEDAALERAANRSRTAASIRFDRTLAAGSTATATVAFAGTPVRNATVEVNGDEVGATGERGRVSFAVPAAEEFELRAKTVDGDVDAEIELEGTALQRAGGATAEGEDEREVEAENEDGEQETERADGDEATEVEGEDGTAAIPEAFDVRVVGDPAAESVRVVVLENGSEVVNRSVTAGERFEAEFEADGERWRIRVEPADGDARVRIDVERETE